MFGEDLKIKKYPYLAYSPNIMEYFAIIGYHENFIPQILDSYRKKNNIHAPTIINSLTSNSDFGFVDNNLIISQIYPENPLTIFIEKNNSNQKPPPTSNVIYSFCFDTTDGTKKSLYICFGFKFFEKYRYYITKTSFEEYYIPKAFCIISQYYYFSLFDYICRNIYALLSQKSNNIPAELTIYNIVNFIPSPINYGLHLDLFGNTLNASEIDIGQLSGYPYLDFDLSEIFNLLPVNLILEIYFVTVLEQYMLLFCSNLELLNMVMFIMYVLNYPCKDSTYFWHIVSVSKNNFVEENKFVGKPFISFLGVNATYSEDFDTSIFGKSFRYIVDIDNKKMFLMKGEEIEEEEREFNEYNNLKELTSYIQNLIREKDKSNDSLFLKQFIERLKKNLDFILSKNPEYNPNPKNKYVNFFKSSKQIIEKNKKIQELFYDFNLNILMILYQDNSLNSSYDRIVKDKPEEAQRRLNKLKNINENIKMNKNEESFCEIYRSTIKYRMYFENFVLNFESVDLYKIPLLFSEEFVNIKMVDQSNKIINKLSLFNIIDSLYISTNQKIVNITLNNIYGDYQNKLKEKFNCFYKNESDNLKSEQQLIVLNKKIINKYMNILYNFYQKEELRDLFPSMRLKEDDPIKEIDRRYIINIIQNTLEQKNFIDISNYLIFSLVYLFSISLPLYSYIKMMDYLPRIISTLSKTKLFMRQHIYIIVKSLYKFYCIHKKQNLYPEINVTCLKMNFYMLINFINENLLVPNEEMMKIFHHFFSKIVLQERDSIKKSNKHNNSNEENLKLICIMKHCFTSKKMFKPKTMINAAMKENNNCNIYIRGGKKQIQPRIQVKIGDYIYTSDFFAPKKIYKIIQATFNDFFDNANLDMSKLKIKNVRDVLVNLIQYGLELNKVSEVIPINFLTDTLYLFKDHEQKYVINDSK